MLLVSHSICRSRSLAFSTIRRVTADNNKDMSSAANTRASLNPSAKQAAALTLKDRKFYFDMPHSLLSKRQHTLDFPNEWKRFKRIVQEITGISDQTDDVETARIIFLTVMQREYAIEDKFRDAILNALRISLDGFCEQETSKSKKMKKEVCSRIKLSGSSIGFRVNAPRLFGNDEYGNGQGDFADFACVVFDGDQIVETTAVVELKLGDTSCADFKRGQNLNLANRHSPLVHGIFCMSDVWHCLVRRSVELESDDKVESDDSMESDDNESGDSTESNETLDSDDNSLLVVVLAARRKEKQADRLCCMEARILIPKKFGGLFHYRIDRCVKFPANMAGTKKDGTNDEYMQALAIFIRALRVGLNYAVKLAIKCKDNGPATLCCTSPIPHLELVASPIPGARLALSSGFTVNQGELYKFNGASMSIKNWFRIIGIKSLGTRQFADSPMDNSLVKVSCSSVHNALVPIGESWTALQTIHASERRKLKESMSNTLLACGYLAGCLVMVMKDFSFPISPCGDPFSLTSLWRAFQSLVNDCLIPMARLGIVHNDIRFDPVNNVMCNLIYCQDAGKFALIDFESLAVFAKVNEENGQNYAISVVDIGADNSPFLFVFWQVLWAAYVWTLKADKEQELAVSSDFVLKLFSKDPADPAFLNAFKGRIGNTLKALHSCRQKIMRAKRDNDRAQIVREATQLILRELTVEHKTQQTKANKKREGVKAQPRKAKKTRAQVNMRPETSFGELDSTDIAVMRSSVLATNSEIREQYESLVTENGIFTEDVFWDIYEQRLEEEYASTSRIL
jgi:hypothetical protein